MAENEPTRADLEREMRGLAEDVLAPLLQQFETVDWSPETQNVQLKIVAGMAEHIATQIEAGLMFGPRGREKSN